MTVLTQDRIRALFDYDAERGVLIWRDRPLSDFTDARACRSWNTRFSGKVAGSVNKRGYREIHVDYQLYLAHRLIWFWHHGTLPDVVDHERGVACGDHVEFLRPADQAGNMKNLALQKRNKSGAPGVDHLPTGKWRASIRVNRKSRHIGHFSTFEEAAAARRSAEAQFGFHPNHGRAS